MRSRPFVLAAVILAAVTSYPAAAGEYSPEADFLARINNLRSSAGVVALTADRELENVAARWARAMANAGGLSHNPDLSAEVTHARKVAENVGVGPSVAAIQQAFERSEGHRANLLDPELRLVGIGALYDKGTLWVVQDFKQPTSRALPSPPPSPPANPVQSAPPAERPREVRTVVFQTGFEIFSAEGVATGSQTWGRAAFSAASASSGGEGRAQLVEVPSGGAGGFWFEVPVTPRATYVQAVDLEILRLHPGGRVEMILEWFDAASRLIGYRLMPVVEGTQGRLAPQQLADAPADAATVRFVVNVTGGGTYIVDNARLEVLAP